MEICLEWKWKCSFINYWLKFCVSPVLNQNNATSPHICVCDSEQMYRNLSWKLHGCVSNLDLKNCKV